MAAVQRDTAAAEKKREEEMEKHKKLRRHSCSRGEQERKETQEEPQSPSCPAAVGDSDWSPWFRHPWEPFAGRDPPVFAHLAKRQPHPPKAWPKPKALPWRIAPKLMPKPTGMLQSGASFAVAEDPTQAQPQSRKRGQSGTIQLHTGFDRNLRPGKAIGRDPPGPSEGVALSNIPSYLHSFNFMMCNCIAGLQCEMSDLATWLNTSPFDLSADRSLGVKGRSAQGLGQDFGWLFKADKERRQVTEICGVAKSCLSDKCTHVLGCARNKSRWLLVVSTPHGGCPAVAAESIDLGSLNLHFSEDRQRQQSITIGIVEAEKQRYDRQLCQSNLGVGLGRQHIRSRGVFRQ